MALLSKLSATARKAGENSPPGTPLQVTQAMWREAAAGLNKYVNEAVAFGNPNTLVIGEQVALDSAFIQALLNEGITCLFAVAPKL